MKRAQLISEIVGEFLLPLLGFIFWDWSLYFILLYIIFDYFIRLVYAFWRPQLNNKRQLIRPFLFFISFLILSHFYAALSDITWRFDKAFSDFFWYDDLFIPQGFILIPLLLYTEYSRSRMEIMLSGSFDIVKMLQNIANRLFLATLILILMSVILAIFSWTQFTATIFFLAFWLFLIIQENKGAFLKD